MSQIQGGAWSLPLCYLRNLLDYECSNLIGNKMIQWRTPEDPGGYDDNIQVKVMAFDRKKSEKKHARKVIKYKKFFGVEESFRTLILQVVEEPYFKPLKEEYIGYGGRTPYKMIVHLEQKSAKSQTETRSNSKKRS